ncbi:MAG TPA: nicotinate phosphoribosyltransferase, partial [Zunongwangia profunda]|nr:nicotinate phosphoribosyltransferase [Zunongwangia profunda]
LQEQDAPIDIYGVGTNLVIGKPDAALDGVYKLTFSDGKPRIKISESLIKTTLPHRKQVYRMKDKNGECAGVDVIAMENENDTELSKVFHPSEPYKFLDVSAYQKEALLQPVMENGIMKIKKRTLSEIAAYSKSRLAELPLEYKRFNNPHIYKVSISEKLKAERDRLISEHKM